MYKIFHDYLIRYTWSFPLPYPSCKFQSFHTDISRMVSEIPSDAMILNLAEKEFSLGHRCAGQFDLKRYIKRAGHNRIRRGNFSSGEGWDSRAKRKRRKRKRGSPDRERKHERSRAVWVGRGMRLWVASNKIKHRGRNPSAGVES